jgi:hypothetical protein
MEATKKPTPIAIITKSSMGLPQQVLQTLRLAMNAEPGGFDANYIDRKTRIAIPAGCPGSDAPASPGPDRVARIKCTFHY